MKHRPFPTRVQIHLEVLDATETPVGCRGGKLVLVLSKVSSSCMINVLSLHLLGQL
jgi:hypothetical protein